MPTPYRHSVWLDVAGVALLLVFLLGSLAYLATDMMGGGGGGGAIAERTAGPAPAPFSERWRAQATPDLSGRAAAPWGPARAEA